MQLNHNFILLGFLAGMVFTAAHYYLFTQPAAAQQTNERIKAYKSVIDEQETVNNEIHELNNKLKEYIRHLLKEKEKQDKIWRDAVI